MYAMKTFALFVLGLAATASAAPTPAKPEIVDAQKPDVPAAQARAVPNPMAPWVQPSPGSLCGYVCGPFNDECYHDCMDKTQKPDASAVQARDMSLGEIYAAGAGESKFITCSVLCNDDDECLDACSGGWKRDVPAVQARDMAGPAAWASYPGGFCNTVCGTQNAECHRICMDAQKRDAPAVQARNTNFANPWVWTSSPATVCNQICGLTDDDDDCFSTCYGGWKRDVPAVQAREMSLSQVYAAWAGDSRTFLCNQMCGGYVDKLDKDKCLSDCWAW